jgi:energy-coupling factor transporter ATP-binding protein EcfA2
MISIDHLTKRYGSVMAVDGLSFNVPPGRVTAFLGPNGAGKTTTLRILLGLAAPDGGTATIGGVRYQDLPDPARTVGAALDSDCFHPGRSAIEHLRVAAIAAGISKAPRHRPSVFDVQPGDLSTAGSCATALARRHRTDSLGRAEVTDRDDVPLGLHDPRAEARRTEAVPGPSAAGVVHEAAGQRDAVSRAVGRGKPGDVGGHPAR